MKKVNWPGVAGLALLGYGLGKGEALFAIAGGALAAWSYFRKDGCGCKTAGGAAVGAPAAPPAITATTVLATGGVGAPS
jgi:uncharacterized protein (UPF0548 family)